MILNTKIVSVNFRAVFCLINANETGRVVDMIKWRLKN
jgi:hypothetical protein